MQAKRRKRSSGDPTQVRFDVPRLLTDLANMPDDGFDRFRKQWKKLYQDYTDAQLRRARDELRLLWSEHVPVELKEDGSLRHPFPALSNHAQEMYEHWQWEQSGANPTGEPLQQHICASWVRDAGQAGTVVDWENRRLRPNAQCLPMVLVWGCLQAADRLAYCHNPGCAAPFFIGKREAQKYCSDACAAPAKREAKLRWWNANRAGGTDPGKM